MLRRTVLPILSVVLLLSGLTGCAVVEATRSPESQWTQTEVLFDVSVSMRDRRAAQLADFERTLRSMNGAGETEVLFINENPLAYPPVASVKVRPYDSAKENEDFYQMAVKRDLQRSVPEALQKVASALKQTSPAKATALIDGLEAAAKSFRAVPYRPSRKRLVILSDVIEDADGVNLLREDLTQKGRQQLIERIRREGRLPDLKDVSVIVAGPRSDPRIPRRVYDRVERWWQEFFAATGAHLNRDGFTPLLRESLLTQPQ